MSLFSNKQWTGVIRTDCTEKTIMPRIQSAGLATVLEMSSLDLIAIVQSIVPQRPIRERRREDGKTTCTSLHVDLFQKLIRAFLYSLHPTMNRSCTFTYGLELFPAKTLDPNRRGILDQLVPFVLKESVHSDSHMHRTRSTTWLGGPSTTCLAD